MKNQPNYQLLETICAQTMVFRKLTAYRLLSLCFLCDWKHAIEYELRISSGDWRIERNRIRSRCFERLIFSWDKLSISEHNLSEVALPVGKMKNAFLETSTQKEVIVHVLTSVMTLSDFNIERLLIATYPFRYRGDLNLELLAKDYRSLYGAEYNSLMSA